MGHDEYSALRDLIMENHTETVQRLTKLETTLAGIPERVTALEQIRWKIVGARGVIVFLLGIATTVLAALGKKLLHQ